MQSNVSKGGNVNIYVWWLDQSNTGIPMLYHKSKADCSTVQISSILCQGYLGSKGSIAFSMHELNGSDIFLVFQLYKRGITSLGESLNIGHKITYTKTYYLFTLEIAWN